MDRIDVGAMDSQVVIQGWIRLLGIGELFLPHHVRFREQFLVVLDRFHLSGLLADPDR